MCYYIFVKVQIMVEGEDEEVRTYSALCSNHQCVLMSCYINVNSQ